MGFEAIHFFVAGFELSKENGEVHIVGQINDFDGPLQFSLTKRRIHLTVQDFPTLTPSTVPIDLDPFIDPTQPTQPTKEPVKEDKKVHRKVIDDGKECKHSDTKSIAALSDSSYDSELAASSDSDLDASSDSDCSNPEYEPDHEIINEDDNDDIHIYFLDYHLHS